MPLAAVVSVLLSSPDVLVVLAGVVSAVLLCFEFGINNNFAQIPAWIFENHHIFTVLTTCVISV